jgi:hypothetical protein
MRTEVTAPPSVERTSEQTITRLFGLTGDAWMRHANPISVWTRFSCLSVVAVAVWSREWIGWLSVVADAAAVVWMMVNPMSANAARDPRDRVSRQGLPTT